MTFRGNKNGLLKMMHGRPEVYDERTLAVCSNVGWGWRGGAGVVQACRSRCLLSIAAS
jgi:hypothetical protein